MIRLTFLILFYAVAIRAVHFRDCGSTAGIVDKVEVSNCDDSAPTCILKKGTDVSFGLHFTPTKDITSVTTVVHGILNQLQVPFPIPNAEACSNENSGVTCPLAANTGTSYHATFPILTKYPSISVIVKWELKDENEDNIVCVEIPVSLK